MVVGCVRLRTAQHVSVMLFVWSFPFSTQFRGIEQGGFKDEMRHQRDEKTGEESRGDRLPEVNVVVHQRGGSPHQG